MSDSQTTKQNLKVLLAVGEEITEISDILVNGVSITDLDIAFAYTKGTATQPHIIGFEKVISDALGDTDLGANIGEMSVLYHVPRTGELPSTNVDIGIYFPNGLYHVFPNGNIAGYGVTIRVEACIFGEPFPSLPVGQQYKEYPISLKTLSPARRVITFMRPSWIPANVDWDIKVTRLTPPSDPPGEIGELFINATKVNFTTYAYTPRQTYAGTALLAIWVEDITIINNTWPEVTVRNKGMQMYCPASEHYNAVTKTYSGVTPWDGTFTQKTFTNNLSYCIYSILSPLLTKTVPINSTGGLLMDIMVSFGIPEANLGIYSFYNFAKYCDETYLGVPRYTINKQFVERMPRKDLLNAMLSLGNAKLTRKHGLLCITWDKKLTTEELDATTLLIPENTASGFEESRSHISERYTHVSVVFEDAENNNVVSSVQADSLELVNFLIGISYLPGGTSPLYFVNKFGYSATNIELTGAMTYQSALIKARGLLFDFLIGNTFITFSGGYEFNSFWDGQIIRTIDTSLSSAKTSGRILSYEVISTLHHLVLKDELTLTPSSFVYFYLQDASLITSEPLTNLENFLTLEPVKVQPHASNFAVGETTKTSTTWIFSLINNPIDNTPYVKASEEIKTWTISNIDFADNIFTIRAKEYFLEKFDFINLSYVRTPVEQIFTALPAVQNVDINLNIKEGFSAAQFEFEIKWQHVLPKYISHSLVITYDFLLTMFDGMEYRLSVKRSFSAHVFGEDIMTATITQEHHATLQALVENYGTYFLTTAGSALTIDIPVILTIGASVSNLLMGIKPSPITTYRETITVNRPSINFIS